MHVIVAVGVLVSIFVAVGVLVVVVPVAVGVSAAVDVLESRRFGYQSGLRLFKVRIWVSLR